jgi:hypothetical protein
MENEDTGPSTGVETMGATLDPAIVKSTVEDDRIFDEDYIPPGFFVYGDKA